MITEIKKTRRPNTQVPFYINSGLPLITAYKANVASLIQSGKYSFTVDVSNDGLEETYTATFADIATFNQVENLKGSEFDFEFTKYTTDNNFVTVETPYTLTGIGGAFDYTLTYSFEADQITKDGSPLYDAIQIAALNQSNGYLQNITVNEDSIIVSFRYPNENEFANHHFNDLKVLLDWDVPNLRRTISYSVV